jgi:hypothetical protein
MIYLAAHYPTPPVTLIRRLIRPGGHEPFFPTQMLKSLIGQLRPPPLAQQRGGEFRI